MQRCSESMPSQNHLLFISSEMWRHVVDRTMLIVNTSAGLVGAY